MKKKKSSEKQVGVWRMGDEGSSTSSESLNKNSLTTSALCDRSTSSDPCVFSGCSSSVHRRGKFQ